MNDADQTTSRYDITVGIGSDTGIRRAGRQNEDLTGSFVNDPRGLENASMKGYLFVLADGMGGARGGAEASRIAVETTIASYYADDADDDIATDLVESIREANVAVWRRGRDPNFEGIGTTIIAAVFRGKRLIVSHVGDSRAWRLRNGQFEKLTSDHTLVQALVDAGILSLEEAATDKRRSILTKNLGHTAAVEPDVSEITLDDGDVIVLCSDGLWSAVPDEEITKILKQHRGNDAARRLIDEANRRGGPDNISVITFHVRRHTAQV